jgi:hypothetical protein
MAQTLPAPHKWDMNTLLSLGVEFEPDSDFVDFDFRVDIPNDSDLKQSNSRSFTFTLL